MKTSVFVKEFTLICTKNGTRGFLKIHLINSNTKMEVFENALIFNNDFHRTATMWMHKNGYLWLRICDHLDQCINKMDVSLSFCTKTEQCERVALMHQKGIITKVEQCERGQLIHSSIA